MRFELEKMDGDGRRERQEGDEEGICLCNVSGGFG
jgi:hypothetical protein